MRTIIYILLFLFVFGSNAQNLNRIYQSHKEDKGLLHVFTNDGTYQFQFYSESAVETTFIPKGETNDKSSHTVKADRKTTDVRLDVKDKNTIEFVSSNSLKKCVQNPLCNYPIAVRIQKQPFHISYYYRNKLITSEKQGYYKSKHMPMEMVDGNIIADTTEKIEFNLTKNEVLYGGGARALGMNLRGYRLPLFNRAHYGYETHSELMNFTMPIVLSSKKYMIHFDNAPIGYLDLDSKKDNTSTYETVSGRKTYQIIVGDTWYDILDNYTDLTGKQPMLPRWALGNFSSRFGYHSQEEVEETIAKFQDENISVDAIILDLYWFGKDIKGTMGNLEVFRDSFPDFEGMVERLKIKGVKTIPITEPFILNTSKKWEEAVSKNILAKDSIGNDALYEFYFGNTGLIDIYKPESRRWFWNIYKDLVDKGVSGVWGDLGEPEVHPHWVKHHMGTSSEVHNSYGGDWAKLVYEGYKRDFPNVRPFILMRAGYSGSQRYGMLPWSGDVNRTWGGLQSQPEIALQMGMQGMAYMHSDLGGFAGDNLDDNLYVRWLQYGVFQPIFRPHAQEKVPSEPIYRSEKTKRLASFAIAMRYRMLPYNYNMMYQNHEYGKPLMRPLFFEDDTPKLQDYSKTYLWGDDILVSPVLKDSIAEQEIYFPKHSKWFEIETDEMVSGGQTKTVKLRPDFIPTYIRAGSFIPLTDVVQSTDDYNPDILQLQYYHENSVTKSSRDLFMDDGITANTIEKKKYQILKFNTEARKKCLEFFFNAFTAENFTASSKTIKFTIHNIPKVPKKIKINGKRVEGKYNDKYRTLTIDISWNTSEELHIKIKR